MGLFIYSSQPYKNSRAALAKMTRTMMARLPAADTRSAIYRRLYRAACRGAGRRHWPSDFSAANSTAMVSARRRRLNRLDDADAVAAEGDRRRHYVSQDIG